MVIAQPSLPVKPATLYVNKADIRGDLHANATWGASQAAIAKAVTEAMLDGTLPPEAADEWCIVTANWVNWACDDLDAVYENNYVACQTAIRAAMHALPTLDQVAAVRESIGNPFYTPKAKAA
jgi:5,6,7,8-tetrahydromethanopterin hydro-lyase